MAEDYILEVDGLDAGSGDAGFAKGILVSSFSWGGANPSSFGQGPGGGSGKATFQDFSFSASTHKGSTELIKQMTTTKHISKITLHCRKGGGSPQEFLTLTLEECTVSNWNVSGGGSGIPHETVQIGYNKFELKTGSQDPSSGNVSMGNPFKFDRTKGTPA